MTHGITEENLGNLSPRFIKRIVDKYQGTRLGRQELGAEILEDAPGALWSRANIEANRIRPQDLPDMVRIVIAIDPAATSNEDSDETGIVACGVDERGHGYVLEDISGIYKPLERDEQGRVSGWAGESIALYKAKHADRIVAEVNNGGEMVETTLRMVDENVAYTAVHASKGKAIRAEPVSALYEQNKVHHVGALARLEDQMCAFTSDFDRKANGYSPDRMDALVWALTELMVDAIPEADIGGFFSVPAPTPKQW